MTGTDALRTWIEASARYREQLELAYAATVLTPGHDREYAYELWRAITEAWEHEQRWIERLACDDRTLLAGECERLYAHLDRLAASADEGFRAVDDGEPASYVYQWTRNMAYAIRHPESPMGDALTAATRGEGDGD